MWPVLLWVQYIVDHYYTLKVPCMYYISLKSCFSRLFIYIKYVKIIGFMIVWVYSKFENLI